MFEVSSEIYKETNFQPVQSDTGRDKVLSKFKFRYPQEESLPAASVDEDGDLVVCRKYDITQHLADGVIEIEHSEATVLKLVGLQVWRGALLLADFLFHKRHELSDKRVLELGAGVGLTSIAASMYARQVTCTDVNIGGILDLIRGNMQRNRKLCRSCDVKVLECDFMKAPDFSNELKLVVGESDWILAADVIYDDELTDAFIKVIDVIFENEKNGGKKKTVFIALEKRYVFTLSECDAVAPMFEYFLRRTINKPWHFEYIPLNFPQYFEYERCKQLVLLRLCSSNNNIL